MSSWPVFLSLVLLLGLCHAAAASKSHPITTFIDAKWNVTPVALEVAEFLADENPSFYWKFIDELDRLPTPINRLESDSKQYKTAIRLAKKFLGESQTELLKLTLSLRSLSARVQAHLQIARDVLESSGSSCQADVFVVIAGKVLCSFDDVEPAIKRELAKDKEDQVPVQQFNFDQIFPGAAPNSVPVILYNEIGSESSRPFHELLQERALQGSVKWINRHFVRTTREQKVRLSGYGVELHMKSTEYKSQDDSPKQGDDEQEVNSAQDSLEMEVNGFDFAVLKRRYPNLETFLDRYRRQMLEKTEEIEPLKAWQFQELGLQAAYQIASIQGDDALQIMQHLAQNFPMQAKTLLSVRVDESFKEEMKHNIETLGRNLNLQPPDAALFVNGLFFDLDTLDTESLLDTLRTEQRSMAAMHQVGVPGEISKPLLTLDLGTSGKDFALDIRDSAIQWINDIEQDASYKRWPSSVFELLRPTFPGMLRSVRKNFFNLVIIFDPVQGPGRHLLKLAESFVSHSAPVRVGLVMDFRGEDKDTKSVYETILYAFNYMYQNKKGRDAINFLNEIYNSIGDEEKPVKKENVRSALKRATTLSSKQLDDVLGEDSDYDYGRQLSQEFVERLGHAKSPAVLMNGVPLAESSLTADDFEEAVLQEIVQQTPTLQKAVYKGELTDTENVLNYLMDKSHVMPRLHPMILNADNSVYLDLSGKEFKDLANVKALATLPNSDMSATLMPNLKYLHPRNSLEKLGGASIHFVTLWVAADVTTSTGRKTLLNALEFVKGTKGARVAFLPNTEASVVRGKENLNNLIWAAVQEKGADVIDAVVKALETDQLGELQKLSTNTVSASELHLKMIRVYCQRVLKLKNQETGVVLNGRVLGPLKADESFSVADYGLMERFVNYQYGEKVRKVLGDQKEESPAEALTSDMLVKMVSILVPRENTKNRFTIPADLKEEQTVLRLQPKRNNEPFFDIVAVIDPASRSAQKLSPLLSLLRTVLNCDMKVFLCAVDKHSDMPVKNFYRFVIDTELRFTKEGALEKGPIAKFTGLPSSSLLTQSLQIPDNWMVEVVNSVYDLDNIRLSEINGPVHSNYELEYLILEGHCFDASTGSPPRGLQFTLGTKSNPLIVDTIVMSNLGYFQLKANPGAWTLRLRHGKSAEIYDINSVEGKNALKEGEESVIVMSSLRSNVVKVKVARKPDQQNADLLADDKDNSAGIWDSIKNSVTGGGGGAGEDGEEGGEVINIFSVASGHLYERLLRIMMLSTLKHTKTPVKFWFLKNYLSPQFIDFLPHMAKEYKFQFELVQYKWPRWLNQQTEKQRIIWGYKILFLDVLFPLGVKKIIFVDADAIVRSDLKELNDLDLGGAPYAYTPFCDSRKDMEGFRFWKQGYWRNHLQGRKYHISALYVVDLRRFRKIAAGDRLRGQYQALSQDPNSLSNLDQDLPNNMIHQVSMKSLPQEWLYCATWCSPDDFKNAKVIDLCNNPQTKEAKLTAAQRIVPEWSSYDSEIKRLMVRVDADLHEHSPRQTVEGGGGGATKDAKDEL